MIDRPRAKMIGTALWMSRESGGIWAVEKDRLPADPGFLPKLEGILQAVDGDPCAAATRMLKAADYAGFLRAYLEAPSVGLSDYFSSLRCHLGWLAQQATEQAMADLGQA